MFPSVFYLCMPSCVTECLPKSQSRVAAIRRPSHGVFIQGSRPAVCTQCIGRINALLANRILVLDQGRIVEQGDHEQLLCLGGHYARLHRYQSAPGLPASAGVRSSHPGRSRELAAESEVREHINAHVTGASGASLAEIADLRQRLAVLDEELVKARDRDTRQDRISPRPWRAKTNSRGLAGAGVP